MRTHKETNIAQETPASSAFISRFVAVLRFLRQQIGGEAIVGMAIINIVLWTVLRPRGVPEAIYVGELLGTTAIVLLSCSLVLATRAPFLEGIFGGLDHMYMWHRWSAITAIVLLLIHNPVVTRAPDPNKNVPGSILGSIGLFGLVVLLLWVLAPRLSLVIRRIPASIQHWFIQYQRWFTLHRLTGLFVIAGLIHGALVDPALRHSAPLLGWYSALAIVGTAAYIQREVLLRIFPQR